MSDRSRSETKRATSARWWTALLGGALSLLPAGCDSTPSARGSNVAAIATEQPNGIAQMVPRLYTSPDVTLSSYAIPDVGGCTGEMIGPNFMMTAAHCNDLDRKATFYTYRNQDPTQLVSEQFQCHILVNTYWKTDITVHYCDPNVYGENPGDKYGYLDLDTSAPTVGEAVYSDWYNPVNSLNIGWGEIYSKGTINSTTSVIWGPQGNTGAQNEPIGIGTDLWSQPGCSGSPILSASNFRMVAGPTSTGNVDAAGRWAQSVKVDLEQGSVDGWGNSDGTTSTGLHNSNIAALGLNAANYSGKIDKNSDYLIDVQQDAEQVRGENARDWYYLGWESPRRNALWSNNGSMTFDPINRTAHLVVTNSNTNGPVFWNSHLPLLSGVSYRVTFQINVNSASSSNALRISFRNQGVEDAGYNVPTTAGAGWQQVTFSVDTKHANDQVAFVVNGTIDATLETFSIIYDGPTVVPSGSGGGAAGGGGAGGGPGTLDMSLPIDYVMGGVMNFDTADKRYNWRNDNTGGRALIVPDGNGGTGPNWAALALPTQTQAAGTDWPVRNLQLGLVPSTTYVICADVRSQASLPTSDTTSRVIRVYSANGDATRISFLPTTSWSTVCSSPFIAPAGANVQIGFAAPGATSGFYVDNMRISRQPCGTAEAGCGTLGSNYVCENNACQCVPKTDPCGDFTCGSVSDGCGHTVECGTDGGKCRLGVCTLHYCTIHTPPPPPCHGACQ